MIINELELSESEILKNTEMFVNMPIEELKKLNEILKNVDKGVENK
jgi:hypothetical protein